MINEENDLCLNVERDAVEGSLHCISRNEALQALSELKTEKAPGTSDVSLELIAASREVGIQVVVAMSKSFGWIWNAI